ncbi:MAG: chromosome partitioning protein ParB, partial [Candidatus Omnitrophota bacterium]|nr:chromosome partitioning protein ParB [Candidatus Omnitrophota bacterium]
LAQDDIANSLSVKELETLIKTHRPRGMKRRVGQSAREPYIAALEEELQHLFATKVRISKRKKRGHVRIEFYSPDDLERIVTICKGVKS